MSEVMQHAVIDHRLTTVEKAVERVSMAVESIDRSLQVIASLEAKHEETRNTLARAFSALEKHEERIKGCEGTPARVEQIYGILLSHKHDCEATTDDHETRVRSIEAEMPTVKLVRGWIIAGVLGTCGIVGSALAVVVMK